MFRHRILKPLLPITGIAVFVAASWLVGGMTRDERPLVDVIHSEGGWADESRCAECHEQADEYSLTGHANTLRPAGSNFSLELLEELCAKSPDWDATVTGDAEAAVITLLDDGLARKVQLDFCFGSGTHANTWTSLLPDSRDNQDLMEFRWTWFRSTEGFSLTPGQLKERGRGAVTSVGMLFDSPKAKRCLSCHSTQISLDHGRIDSSQMVYGIGCQRCHGPRQAHVESRGTSHPADWQIKDQMDSVMRCAVCHRMPGERDPHEIRPGNVDIVRFQPMGLLQSACFLKSEMTCVTCHDPHRPMSVQDSLGTWQCIQCHNPAHTMAEEPHITCAAGEIDRCVECHMPKVPHDFPVSFTDHWIRVPGAKVE